MVLTDDMKRVVEEQGLGFVATVCPDGTPNVSPKGTVAVWDDDHLVFADLRSPGTIRNIRDNPIVEINVVDPIVRKGYRFKGQAQVHTEGEVFDSGLEFYGARGLERYVERIKGIVMIRVDKALPLTSPAYDLGMTEEQVKRAWRRRMTAVSGLES